ncbi:ABC transporter permease [Chelatococcus composti]|jgi:sulfonate transport system permease protein|uniref:NitT/TauT family transport system permease protein n=1 Tax=Chelatococcus composti TaxID=1743235 RepID=A0A841K6E9_9HYPH|nr:ABC transporter permease [Chelatococcus composti]MBB6168041.1 NitT/TauT family transport system permease protein [Chelatococcus composti]MBS7734769.1 ABC transporter permease [Chelatococcus composti]PZN43050.1 MAG: ABC transporter permease [Pseudomonadota bacterium]GGG34013.1 ABC transporter permease [Chelatococcus composti]
MADVVHDLQASPAAASRPVVFRGGLFVPRTHRLIGFAALVALILLWQAASSLGWVSPVLAPSPGEVIDALWRMALSGELATHLSASLLRLAGGFAIGVTAGIAFGMAIGLSSLVRSPGATLVAALFPIPKIALLPLFILWFGIGESSKVATIAFGTFFPTVIATYGAVDNVDRSLVRMGRSFGLSSFAIISKIILPGALPGILSGLRIASSIGIVLLIAAEMIGANEGVGAMVLAAGNLMQSDRLLAGVVVLSLLGLAVSGLIGAIEKRLLAWR